MRPEEIFSEYTAKPVFQRSSMLPGGFVISDRC